MFCRLVQVQVEEEDSDCSPSKTLLEIRDRLGIKDIPNNPPNSRVVNIWMKTFGTEGPFGKLPESAGQTYEQIEFEVKVTLRLNLFQKIVA
jgi:hypothetical protein